MSFPNPDAYVRAVQNPAVAFAEPTLKQARFVVSPLLGVPIPASGTTAVVFRAQVSGVDQALRFFIREDASSRERYTALGRYLVDAGLTDNMASADWSDQGIRVDGSWYPMVRMQWVDGRTLDRYVEHLVKDADRRSLETLAHTWRDLVRRMQQARFAHGDLQHGNILVDARGVLRLVDFDCSWIAPFAGKPRPTESGHRNYQRPDASWGPWMDTFPALVIYLSLFALSRNPRPWDVLYQEENLLFQRDDFDDFDDFDAAVWKQLAALRDPQVDTIVMRLKECCTRDWKAEKDLEAVLEGRAVSSYRWVRSLRPELLERPLPRPEPATTLRPPPPKPTRPKPTPTPPPAAGRPRPPVRPGAPPRGATRPATTWWTPTPAAPPSPPPRRSRPARPPRNTSVDVAFALFIALGCGLLVGILSAATARSADAAAFWAVFLIVAGVSFPIVLLARRAGSG
jgi:serine/threonine protein kinase